MAEEKTLDDLFLDTLKDIYFAEKQIVKPLPKMAKAAQSEELLAGFEQHLEEIHFIRRQILDMAVRERPQNEVRFPEPPVPGTELQFSQAGIVDRHWTGRYRAARPLTPVF